MQNAGKSRKPLVIGIIAAVVVLAVLLALVLTQCVGGTTAPTTDPNATAGTEVPTYQLYWNVDRAEYDGKSEAGMSSRMPESDGYFHVRFVLDGEEVVLKVADRKLINAIDIKDLMGLEFDENGIVVNVLDLEDMPLEKLGWQFYVQSAAKKLIKLNSSESMNGMEVLLEMGDEAGVYDMSGKSGPVGVICDPINMDRVYAVANLAGEVTHVFVYQRPNYMLTHEAECQHCKKVVTWYEWVKEDQMPTTTGHYQLQNDIQLAGQPAQAEDAKVCIDLNGKRVDGKAGSRCYAMFNAGTELAIMDTSAEQTGKLAAHGKGDQGMVVWVRYGAFYLYGGTLDASDATTKLSGTAIECGKGKYFYMFGGTIIGGTAEPQQNAAGKWAGGGLGGTISLGGKMVMHAGEIRNGNAPSKITKKDGQPVYNRGFGGNIYMSTSAVLEMNGGVIKNGKAGNLGGNIYMEGAAELTINGGKIQGGTINGKGKNGGSIYAGSKTIIVQNGGTISGGSCRNCGGNIYTNGRYTMKGGVITGGTIRDFTTGKKVENAASANMFIVNGKFYMYGGTVTGGVQAIDTNATDKNDTTVLLSGYAKINGGENCTRNLTLSTGGSGVTVRVGNMLKGSLVGVYATTGYFTLPTKEANKDHFFSDIEGAEILYHDERLALGRLQCICGSNSENVEDHLGNCKAGGGEKVVFAPWLSGSSMPNTTGNYYLLAKTLNMNGTSIVTPGDGQGTDVFINVDLNGKEIVSKSARWYSLFENKVAKNEDGSYAGNIEGEHIELSVSDSVGTAKVTLNERASSDMGYLIWGRYNDSIITIYGGEFDGSAVRSEKHDGAIINAAGVLNIHGGKFTGGYANRGGIISARDLNMTGGIIENGTARYSGGNIRVSRNFNMTGGTIRGGSINAEGTLVGDLGYGGNVMVDTDATMNMTGGTIEKGLVRIGVAKKDENGNVIYKPDGKPEVAGGGGLGGNIIVYGKAFLSGGVIRDGKADTGGNIGTNGGGAEIRLGGTVKVLDGVSTGSGGNVAINVRGCKVVSIADDALISGGVAGTSGGNLYANAWVANGNDAKFEIVGGTIKDGTAGTEGGNIYLKNTTSGATAGKSVVVMSGGTISGGKLVNSTKNGGSIYLDSNTAFTMNGGTVTGGGNAKQGGNFYLLNSSASLTVNGGSILNGDTNDCGGNIQLQTRAKLFINGGRIEGGTKNGACTSNSNIYSVNGDVTVTGGEIVGSFGNTSTYNGGCLIKFSGTPKISVSDSGHGITFGSWASKLSDKVAIALPRIEVGELTEDALVHVSTTGYTSFETEEKYVANFKATPAHAGVHYLDNCIFVGKVACICGGTADIGPCAEGGHKQVGWTAWGGKSADIYVDGNYYLTADQSSMGGQLAIGGEGTQTVSGVDYKYPRPNNVSINLNGHKLTTTFRVFQLWNESTMNIADHVGGGAILSKGNTGDNFGGIQQVNGGTTVNLYSGLIAMAEGHTQHKEIGLIGVGGTFNMYGGEIAGTGNPSGSLINVGKTFNMYAGIVRDGYNNLGGGYKDTSGNVVQGGNFRVLTSGTLNISGGTVSGGKAQYGGNIFVLNGGKVNISGDAAIKDGHGWTGVSDKYPQGGNIYLTGANARLNMNGGTVSGGKLTDSSWMPGGNIYANSKAQLTFDGGALVEGGDGQDGNNLYLTSDGTTATLKNCTFKNTVDGTGNIMVERGNVIIDGATIINTANGYNLRANESQDKDGNKKIANYTLNSGLISGGKPNVTLGGLDTFVMNGGTIENGSSAEGGNIYITAGTVFTMNGGTIQGGESSGRAGSIMLHGTSVFDMKDGEVKDGNAKAGNGGNFIVDAQATLNISGGTISGGRSSDSGGNIAVYGKVVMSGGLVTNGYSKNTGNGMNISIIASGDGQLSALEMTGGTIAGGVHFNNWYNKNYNNGEGKQFMTNVSLSGNPVIDKELATANKPTYSMALSTNDLTIGQFTDGAKIMVSGPEGVFSYAAPAGSDQYFKSEVTGLTVWQIDGELVLVHGKQASCVCGVNSDNPDDHIGECDGEPHFWLPVNYIPTESGYYYLVSDVTDNGSTQRILKPGTVQDIYLDLNGKTVTSNRWRMYRLDSAVNLTITDNSAAKTGTIKVGGSDRDQGGVVWFFGGASTFSMYGGTLDATGIKNNSTCNSAGIVLAGGSGTYKLFAGTIKGGEVTNAGNWGGNAISLDGGKAHYFGNIEVTGGAGSEIFISDNSKIDFTYVTEAPETPWAVDAAGIFTKGWDKDTMKIEDYFTSASESGAQIYVDEATGELKMGKYYCVCGQTTHVGDCNGDELFWTPYRNNAALPVSTGNYYLVRNISVAPIKDKKDIGQYDINSTTKQTVRLDLAGKNITSTDRVYLLQKSNELIITDTVGTGVITGGGHSGNGGVILTQDTSTFTVYGGTITLAENAVVCESGSVLDIGKYFNIYGGTILSNKITGSGVLLRDAAIAKIAGGTIKATASSDSTIVKNIAVWGGTNLTISGGIIESTGKNCRNINSDGTVTMTGGEIKGGNTTLSGCNGGSIFQAKGTFTVSGGTISGGVSSNQGGNIVVYGNFIVSGNAVIKDGKSAGKDNYNISVISTNAVLDIRGGTIAGGILINNGAGQPTVKLSGKPVINAALTTTAELKPSVGINWGSASKLIDVTGLTGGEIHIYATKAGQFATNATEGMEKFFVSETVVDGTKLPVCYADGGLHFGLSHCLCGASKTNSAHEYWCDKVVHLWMPWDGGAFMTDGYYFATGTKNPAQTSIGNSDAGTAAAPQELVTVHAVLDLNGKTLTSGGRAFRVENGSFAVTDSVGGGKIVAGGTGDQSGALLLSSGVTVNLYKGDWTLTAGKKAGNVGGIMDIGTDTTVNMYSGTISGGVSSKQGGNISLSASTSVFNFYGGTISGGTAQQGGNVRVAAGQFNMIPSPLDTKGVATRTVTGGLATVTGGYAKGGNIYATGSNAKVVVEGAKSFVNNGDVQSFTAAGVAQWAPGGNFCIEGSAQATVSNGVTVKDGKNNSNGHNFYMTGDSSKLTLNSITVENSMTGDANIYIEGGTLNIQGSTQIKTVDGARNINTNQNGKAVINISGGTITGATYDGDGANIWASSRTTLNISGGTITGGKAKGTANRSGGNICVAGQQTRTVKVDGEDVTYTYNDAVLNITGGTISNGEAAYGGNIRINGKQTHTMSAGEVFGGTSTGNGGNVYVNAGTFTLSGGEVRNGNTSDGGGNFAVYATLKVEGGKIYGGLSSDADEKRGNIYAQGTVTVTGGEIRGGVLIHKTSDTSVSTLNLGGAAVINGKLNETATPSVTFWGTNPKPVNITSKLTGTACIGIATYDWAFANAGTHTAGSIGAFFADDESRGIFLLDSTDANAGMLYVGHYACICGGTATKGACADGGHAKVRWTPWDGTMAGMTKSGNYYLIADCTNPGGQIVSCKVDTFKDVSVNLNGHSITAPAESRIFQLWNTVSGSLNIADHKGNGKLLTMGNSGNYGIIQVYGGAHTVNFYSGYMGMAGGHNSSANYSLVGVYGTTVFNMYDGTMEGGGSVVSGSNVVIGASATFNMYGGTVTNGNKNGNGGNFYVEGTLNLYKGATVSNGIAYTGGNIYVNGKLNMYGGTVENGSATGSHGGNVRIDVAKNSDDVITRKGQFVMNDGLIQNGYADKQGGNVNIPNDCVFTMKGGEVKNGYSSESGANVLINGELIMEGGLISGGFHGKVGSTTVKENSNVFAVNGYMTMTGGTLDGANFHNTTAGGCELKISGSSVITNKNGYGLSIGGTPLATIELGKLSADASICVNGQLNRVFAAGEGATFANKARFSSNNGYKVICTEEGMMMVDANAHTHCVCGGQETGDPNHKCYDVIFTEAPATIESGKGALAADTNWYLDGDMTIKDTVYINSSNVKICMNGHNINATQKYRAISLYDKATADPKLTLTTCTNAGDATKNKVAHTNAYEVDDMGQVLWVRYGQADLYGVTIDGAKITGKNKVNATTGEVSGEKNGTTIQVSGTLNIYKGTNIIGSATKTVVTTLADNSTKTAYAPNGAAIQVGSGKAVMYGGTITGGKSANDAGSVYVSGSASFTMHDGTITGGTATNRGGNIRIDGSASFTMNGGKVTLGKSNSNGGNFTVKGKLYILGGEVSDGLQDADGSGGAHGGNIYIDGTTAKLKVENATIKNGGQTKNERYGGNIAVSGAGAAEFVLGEGTVISGGKGHRGGNLYFGDLTANYDTYVIDGATISGGNGSYRGSNICAHQATSASKITVTFKSGSITLDTTSLPSGITADTIALGAGGGTASNVTFRMEGGTLSGGNILLYGSTVFEFVKGTLDCDYSGDGSMIIPRSATE